MEYLVTLRSIAQNLFSTLQSSELKQFCSVWGYKSELDKLQTTANKVKALLHDAERSLQQGHIELSEQDQLFVEDLKHLVYDTEDLLQTILTLAEQRQLRAQEDEGDNIITKFRRFFSFEENPLVVAIRGYRGVKEIENRLDEITLSHNRLNLKKGDLNFQPIHWRREETDSCAYALEIIGRDDDIDKIVGVLLDPNVQGNVSYYCIVGMGGLGKTAVANKVYNDPRLRGKFSLKLWVCVSDENPDCLDLKATLRKILKSIATDNCDHFSLEQLQTEVRKRLEVKKYLLILDDVWNENREQWLKLEKYFQGGIKGSWILVTTRSEKTAKIVAGDKHIHKLKGLSNDDSWCLFESLAFDQRSEQGCYPDLVEIGKRIVKKCANVPLAIRVVGSLLYGQGKQRWLTFEAIQLGGIKEGGNGGIKAILELSYFHLPTALKICFTYCALFPKDYRIDKEMLINLWRAQGFVIPQYEVQTLEDASEEYFSILASRSFFQDISKRSDGKISFTLHDLMHDIARGVVGKEIHAIDSGDPFPSNLNERTRHLYLSTGFVDTQSFFTGTKIRTFLQMKKSNQYHHVSLWCHSDQHLSTLLANWVYLRALDLSGTGIKDLPSTVGKLELLRYLDLSKNEDLKELPDSITGLHNLEILLLSECHSLEKLPEEFSKLTKLRVLDTLACHGLQYMPRHMGRLTCLEKLPWYVVGDRSSCKQQRGLVDQLQELKALKNIKGELCIMLHSLEGPTFAMEDGGERGYLSEHQYLTKIKFDIFPREFNEALLEDLRPHCKLVELELRGIGRERVPNWAREDNLTVFLPNLTNLTLDQCDRLRHLSGIGKLPKLKSLVLENLSNLEYIETTRINSNSSGVEALESQELFFPCLASKYQGWRS